MDESLLLGIWKGTLPIPKMIWQRQVKGAAQLDLMTEDHHRVRNFVVTELPRTGEPLSPDYIASSLHIPHDQVVKLLDDLEKHKTFLFRDNTGSVLWAYPVTVDQTPHEITFSTGECINAA